jgi:hypothetical protein
MIWPSPNIDVHLPPTICVPRMGAAMAFLAIRDSHACPAGPQQDWAAPESKWTAWPNRRLRHDSARPKMPGGPKRRRPPFGGLLVLADKSAV